MFYTYANIDIRAFVYIARKFLHGYNKESITKQANKLGGSLMVLLVTGGAGFIGANFIEYERMVHKEDQIVCLDALTYAGNLANLNQVKEDPGFVFVKGDIADKACVEQVFKKYKPDYVVNFAAESHVDRSIEDADLFLRTNILGTQVLLEACRIHGIKRFHQISTDEVYGDLPIERTDLFFTEESPICTSSPYSASKASADLFVLAYHRTYKVPVTISRCSNNYGPYQHYEKLIPCVISRAISGREVPVYGTGENVRDWLYVKDHCKAVDLILRNGTDGEVYNVGGHNERVNLALIKEVIAQAGGKETQIAFVTDRPGHDRRYAIDATKARKELGWKPEVSFEEGLKETVSWYLNHREYLER